MHRSSRKRAWFSWISRWLVVLGTLPPGRVRALVFTTAGHLLLLHNDPTGSLAWMRSVRGFSRATPITRGRQSRFHCCLFPSSSRLFALIGTSGAASPSPRRSGSSLLSPLVQTRRSLFATATASNNMSDATNDAAAPRKESAASMAATTTTTTTTTNGNDSYDSWVRRLYTTNLYQPVKMGLANIQQLYDLMERPLDNVPVIHIAGTNGKGSVALKLAKTLEAAAAGSHAKQDDSSSSSISSTNHNPYKVGLFVSPHIASFRERMQVNGQLITEEQVVELLPPIYDLCHAHDIPATFFELTTALAMQYFRQQHVDAVVLETGLGGRLDATNIVTTPALTIVTSIGLEHTRILGDTLEQIASEKAGIFKSGRPVLVGPVASSTPQVDATLRKSAANVGAGPYYTCHDVLGDDNGAGGGAAATATNMDYDQINSRIVTAAIRILQKDESLANSFPTITDEAIRIGTSQRPPCRFEHILVPDPSSHQEPLTVILDVAHNPEAMDYLVGKLKATYDMSKTALRIVVGMSSDKDLTRCGQAILDLLGNDPTRVHLVQAASPRAATLQQLLEIPGFDKAHYNVDDTSVATQVQQAVELSMKTKAAASSEKVEILVVCGSVFIMADARQALGIDEPRDSAYISQVGGPGARNSQENFGGGK